MSTSLSLSLSTSQIFSHFLARVSASSHPSDLPHRRALNRPIFLTGGDIQSAEMIDFENRKGQDLQKPYPRCVGRLINIFDLSSGIMPRTKLLTDKPHRDGSPTSRNRSDMVKKLVDSVGVEDNLVPNDHRKGSNRKSIGTPMKMLIEQELSREMESKQKPPNNIVARLMGLDSVPAQKMDPTPKRSLREGYSCNFPSGDLCYYRQMEDGSRHTSLKFDTPSSIHDKEYKDVYEVWQQPSRAGRFKDRSPLKGRINENLTEKRMALVRQKFTEAKRLATDELLLQSKEFQDALDVLSSNRDLFLKFLEEPNSLFSKHFCEIQTVPSSQTKRITVLKPSKTIEVKAEAQVTKPLYPPVENIDHMNTNQRNLRSSSSIHYRAKSIPQPTRIVVLKPNSGTPNAMKTTIASPATPPKQAEGRGFNDSLESDESIESREVAKEITRRMQQYFSSHQRDEALLSSSALSNGYVGDVSSFNEEGCCIASDSEAATPTTRHPWDYNNGFGSPYSISSFSRASSSPEPSVVKEAKKRLSERWAMVTSNGIYEEPNQMRRSSSTLGEMLSFPEVKTEEGSDNLNISSRRFCGGEQELKPSIGCFSTGGAKVRCGEDAPRNLPRSKSLPTASSVFKNIELNEVVPRTLTSKTIVPKDVPKSKNGVSSFKGKLSSLFSRSKKLGTEKHIPSPFFGTVDRLHSRAEESCKRNDALSESFCEGHSEVSMLVNSEKFGGASSTPNTLNDGQKHPTPSAKGSHSSDISRASDISRENQDQPSPISVLETPFEDDANSLFQRSTSAISGHPQALSRSSPIESISRTLTRDSPHLGRPPSNSSELSKVLSKECEEQERFAFVQKLLSSASLDSRDSVLARWHSLDSPLDPTLLDEFLDRKEEEAKCRERRSNQRLLFDCVNAALLDISRSTLSGYYPYARACGRAWGDGKKCFLVAEEVWRLVRGRFSSVDKQVSCEGENRNLVVEGLVKKDVAGSGWSESMHSEIDEFSKEIGREVLEDLVKEVLADLTVVCFL